MFFCMLLFMFSFFFIIYYNVHYMMILLFLELLLLSIFLWFTYHSISLHGLLGLFMFLLFMVCMGGFSISLLICLSRCVGQDFWFIGFVF